MKRPGNDIELADWLNGVERAPAEAPVTAAAVDVPLEHFWRVIGWPGRQEEGRSRMDMSDQINELAAALAKAQAVMVGATKDSVNPAFRSKYADLASTWEACRKALTANGLSVTQIPSAEEGRVTVTTVLFHASGQYISGTLSLRPAKDDAHGLGSALTYLRRYGLAAMVGVAPEDDDGNAAVEAAPVATAKPVPAGYDDWVTDLTSAAESGLDALRAAWTASKPVYRTHAGPAFLDRLKAKAKAAAGAPA